MKNPVNQQKEDLFLRLDPDSRGVPPGGVRGDHHIAQDVGLNFLRLLPPHRKGNDVGGAWAPKILIVQEGDLVIVHDHDADLGVFTSQGA